MERRVDDLANAYVDQWAELSPTGATYVGIEGYDDKLDDLTRDGYEARADLDRRTLAALDAIEPADERELVAKEAMKERLELSLARFDAGEVISEISVISSGLHELRQVFDLMPLEGAEAAGNITARLEAFPDALRDYRRTLLDAAAGGKVAARAQMLEVVKQTEIWTSTHGDDFYRSLVRRVKGVDSAQRERLEAAAERANTATLDFGHFLRDELAPLGRDKQAAGRERYELASQYFLGARIDLDETYAWGFEELHRLETEMAAVSADIAGPGATLQQAVEKLDATPKYRIEGKEAFREWMQQLGEKAISDLHGTHFDIPGPAHRIEARIAPTSDGGIYYTGPSEDFTRPGSMWWAVPQGINEFSTWREVTTVYHEGVPGHHLQIAQTVFRAELLNRYQRLLCWCSGHGEGWALYAERLMDDLGYLSDPADKLGMLDGQAMRAARVIVDIGMHLELEIPRDNPFGFHPGERWTPEFGWEFMRAHCRVPDENLRFELNRYLGWPGQAPSYKVGERIWLQARDDAKARKGDAFDLKQFHSAALNLGILGLDPLRKALARL